MPIDHIVEPGECVISIAEANGHFWETLWDASQNRALRDKRSDPNCLVAGDKIHIPDIVTKEESKGAGQRHRFRRKGVPAKLRIQMLSPSGQPRANRAYRVDIDGAITSGQTDADGMVDISIPCGATNGTLILEADGKNAEERHPLALGKLEPATEIKGAQARLKNLGSNTVTVNGQLDEQTKAALRDFQAAQGLSETGELDQTTSDKLREVHGS